uniref:Cilia and flagella associated protein 100 n=1 Tax=Sphenodon punctatus TaxID=8508 RepID=A0A8D0HCG2_SPHPU
SDIDIFQLRDKEREKAKVEHERRKTLKIHEKMTYSTLMNAKQSGFKKKIQMEEEAEDRELAAEAERLKALRESISWKLAVTKGKGLQVERETMHDYINQKRQMFLLQYSVVVKRDEIKKLENMALQEESKVEKAEEYLEKDAAMFDEFLKENDKNSAQALKTAEKETKAKMEKIAEIRELSAQIMNMESENSRFKDTLKEYKMYRDFLYQLSPKEWQEEHGIKQLKEASKPPVEQKEIKTTPSTTLFKGKCAQERLQLPPAAPNVPSEDMFALHVSRPGSETQDQEPELYFTDPHQLLSIFTELEEQNLSLIQNSRETEETLDELQGQLLSPTLQHASTALKEMPFQQCLPFFCCRDREIQQLKQLAATLKASILKEEETAADLELKARVFSFGEYKADVQDKMLVSLHKKVLEVYRRCIGENEANLGTLQMLTIIEHQLDDLLECLERVPPAKIEQAEKVKEKERRMRMREEKIRQQRALQEERVQRALARAQADIKKKTGRRLVFRSEPPPMKEKEDDDQGLMDQEKEEQLYYFT